MSQPIFDLAVIGGGISGMSAAYFLAAQHHVTLFEAAPRLGGHARTVMAGKSGTQPVDTGFIVFNYANYPHLTQMFHDLDVPVAKSDMSFGASVDQGRVEYGLHQLTALVGQKRNLARPQFYRMVRDILRFNAKAEAASDDPALSIGDLLQDLRLGDWFQRYYLLPVCGAIWSTPPDQILDFPARSLIRFFRNHALLSHKGQHQWWTVDGGSIEYVRRLAARLALLGTTIRVATPVRAVQRQTVGCLVVPQDGPAESFDEVIFACHADQALRMIGQPTLAEQQVLVSWLPENRLDRATAMDLSELPPKQAAVAEWLARKYRVAPEPVAALVVEAHVLSRSSKLPANLILAVMAVESSFHPYIQSQAGAQGLMQVMTGIHTKRYEAYGGNMAAFDPRTNMRVGVAVLVDGIKLKGGSVEEGLRLYLGVDAATEDGGYVAKVLAEQARLDQVAAGVKVPVQ